MPVFLVETHQRRNIKSADTRENPVRHFFRFIRRPVAQQVARRKKLRVRSTPNFPIQLTRKPQRRKVTRKPVSVPIWVHSGQWPHHGFPVQLDRSRRFLTERRRNPISKIQSGSFPDANRRPKQRQKRQKNHKKQQKRARRRETRTTGTEQRHASHSGDPRAQRSRRRQSRPPLLVHGEKFGLVQSRTAK